MRSKILPISILLAAILVAGTFLLSSSKEGPQQISPVPISNVSTIDGKQIIEIHAKGGYSPKSTLAKAGVPTVLKVTTSGTFDCSSALTVPSLSYRGNLPATGETLIDVPPQEAGAVVRGVCSMGMYSFTVTFK
jgi:plastocyanin domain-containing protein